MSLEQTFAEYFKPEIQNRGREEFLKGQVFITTASDTQVQGLVKGMSPLKVSFQSDDIASPTFTASCTCTVAAKGSYCKHMWAMLLATEKKHPDFLDSKTGIEQNGRSNGPASEKPKSQMSAEAEARASAYKEKATQFRKQQYEKQKAWAKDIRQQKKGKPSKSEEPEVREKYPAPIEEALEFFTKNGFVMEDVPNMEVLNMARKILSRVFHPDKGGSHDEAVVLNLHHATLNRFIKSIDKD